MEMEYNETPRAEEFRFGINTNKRSLKNVLSLGKDTEGRVEKVLEWIPSIGSYSKVNPFK